ncbi:polyhydroxyalkanoate synthase [Ancylobacter sp. 3268]|uniref:alpha/beta hydrolase n=1 Tax=Ancylobacter sp. 3268 TaxID=2817752 RepID=UPI00285B7D4B|nr:alpha/beta hydrolase [Ancylobacter sp. 3268]MDR6953299.1 polyhydroxyalkanoate synthase [Ancylobacter sp. 3268]
MEHLVPQSSSDPFAWMRAAQLEAMDELRGVQARALDLFGFGSHECPYDVIAAGPHWRLRRYRGGGDAPPLLFVPAPIKRPYVWDLTPKVSVVRFCLERPFAVHLLEWLPPKGSDSPAGIADYVQALLSASRTVADRHSGKVPIILGHSLGGTLAAIACALQPGATCGLVLLGAPLSFAPGSSAFRDVVVEQKTETPEDSAVPGSQLSQCCALLAPATFVWSRWMDAALSVADPAALDLHIRVERWALDEVPLPGRLVHEIVRWLYREDRFRRGRIELEGRRLGPPDLRVPVLALVNPSDEIGPRAAVAPFFVEMATNDTCIIEHPPEVGVGLQHLAILAGRRAHAETWPQIAAWIDARAGNVSPAPPARRR